MMAHSMPSDDYERLIQRNVESNRGYISQNLNWKDLVIYYNLLTRDEVQVLRMRAKTDEGDVVQKALDMIIVKTQERKRFSALVESLREAEYPKIADVLEGKGVITHGLHRKILKDCTKVIRQMLNPEDILHCLVARDILSGNDAEFIKNKGKMENRANAVFELLQLLPNRNVEWFSTFMQVLKENSYEDLVSKIDKRVRQVSQSTDSGELYPSVRSQKVSVSDPSENPGCDTFTKEQMKKVLKELDSLLKKEQEITHEEHSVDQKPFELLTCVSSCKGRQENYCVDHKVVFCGQCNNDHGDLCEINCLSDIAYTPDTMQSTTEELNEVSSQLMECMKTHETQTLELRQQADECLETISKIKNEIAAKLENLQKQREQEVRFRTNLSSSLARYDIKLCKEHLNDLSRVSQQCKSAGSTTPDGLVATVEAQYMINKVKKTIERLNGITQKGKVPVICDKLQNYVETESQTFCEVRLDNVKK